MRAALAPIALSALLLATGCFDAGEPLTEAPPTGGTVAEPELAPAPADAAPFVSAARALHCLADHPEQVRAIQRVRQIAEASVHELVTCGGAQLQVSAGFVARVLLSNPQFFDPETLETLDGVLGFADLPFERRADGSWRMPLNPGSTFDLRFLRPGSQAVVTADVFDLASYLTDAQVETSLSFEEMLEDIEAPNTYQITWAGDGPLAAVLFPDGPPAERRFVVEASLLDLAMLALGYTADLPDFGPFERLPDLELESAVDLKDARDGVNIGYAFTGERQSLGHFHTAGQVAFELHTLVAEGDGVVLQGEAADLRVLGRGALAGPLVYAVDGVAIDGVRVVDDFGDGGGYPEASYWCPADWAEAPWSN